VLRRLNGIFGSCVKVFSALHTVQELEDHSEVTADGMRQSSSLCENSWNNLREVVMSFSKIFLSFLGAFRCWAA
jgi:hypothetical protein